MLTACSSDAASTGMVMITSSDVVKGPSAGLLTVYNVASYMAASTGAPARPGRISMP